MTDAPRYTVEHDRPAAIPFRTPAQRKYDLTLFKDIDPAPRKEWMVKDLLGSGELSIVYGAPGSGKSVVVADMAAHVAAGRDWQGQRVRQGGVLYIAAERGGLVKRRLAAWRKHHRIDDIPLAVVAGNFDLWSNRTDTTAILEMAKTVAERTGFAVAWIVIDTVAQVMPGGDENSGKDMGALTGNLAYIQHHTGAHVTAIHHVPHGDQTRMRGHGVLLGAADSTISVEKDAESGRHTLMVRKANDGPDTLKFGFDLTSILLSTDPETGDETNAPVVVPADVTGQGRTNGNVRLSNSEELVKRILADLVEEVGKPPPAYFRLPQGTMAVDETAWRNACYDRRISESDKADTRRKNFARAADGLHRKGLIGKREGLVWLAR